MNYDEYGEVINSPETFETIARELYFKPVGAVMIGWSDGNGTHLDILFCGGALPFGSNFQGGIRPHTDLIVSVMRVGAFAFQITENPDTHPDYYSEKLKLTGLFFGRANKFAELVNGVRHQLAVIEKNNPLNQF